MAVTVTQVNDAFYDAHPEMVVHGKRQPIPTTNKALAREWAKIREELKKKAGCAPARGGGKVTTTTLCKATPKIGAPPYDAAAWNDAGKVQNSTNCYAYAVNSRIGHLAGTKPQPGEKSHTPLATLACADLQKSVLADGKPADILAATRCAYQKKHQLPPPDKKGYYLVALVATSNNSRVIDPSVREIREPDYHWYRQDADGGWSHKPGHDPVRRVDASGAPITNPETANRRSVLGTIYDKTGNAWTHLINYDVFCGYYYVKSGGAKVGP